MQEEVNLLKQQVATLTERLDKLNSSTTIPFETDRAFRDRLKDITGFSVSVKGADTEDVTVVDTDGGVINTYVVMNDPDGFLQVTINGIVYYLPYFS